MKMKYYEMSKLEMQIV